MSSSVVKQQEQQQLLVSTSVSQHIHEQLSKLIDTTTTTTDSNDNNNNNENDNSNNDRSIRKVKFIQKHLLPYFCRHFDSNNSISNSNDDTMTTTTGNNDNNDDDDVDENKNHDKDDDTTTTTMKAAKMMKQQYKYRPTSTTSTTTSNNNNIITTTATTMEPDAYITLYGNHHQAYLPSISYWNTTFRKAYTILFWIRIRIGNDTNDSNTDSDNQNRNNTAIHIDTTSTTDTTTTTTTTTTMNQLQRILYRFSTSPLLLVQPSSSGAAATTTAIAAESSLSSSSMMIDDDPGTGICVTCSPWTIVVNNNDTNCNNNTNNNDSIQLQSTLTAYALPYYNKNNSNNNNNNNNSTTTSQNRTYRSSNNNNRNYNNYSSSQSATTSATATATNGIVQQTITVTNNTWHLVGCTHVYPYLQHPIWTVCIDGQQLIPTTTQQQQSSSTQSTTNMSKGRKVITNELPYPILSDVHVPSISTTKSTNTFYNGSSSNSNNNNYNNTATSLPAHLRSMEYCSILHNITAGGVTTTSATTVSDETATTTILPLCCDVSSVALYNEAISPVIQAIIHDAGPTIGQQQNGYIVPFVPPIANWTKGCSLAGGPKVGIPLLVHSHSLSIQQCITSHIQFACTATTCTVLGTNTNSSSNEDASSTTTTRLVCPFIPIPGKTDATPRIGLIQPIDPNRANSNTILQSIGGGGGTATTAADDDDDTQILYITGQCKLVHKLQDYLSSMTTTTTKSNFHDKIQQQQQSPDTTALSLLLSTLTTTTQNWSIAWMEQQCITMIILPFVLAGMVPISVEQEYKNQTKLYLDSFEHLYDVYSHNGQYAVSLFQFFISVLQNGGARVQEEILQNGIIHILSISIRYGLVRAIKYKLYSCPSHHDFINKMVPKIEEQLQQQNTNSVNNNVTLTSNIMNSSPSYIPPLLVDMIVQLMDVCCGPPIPNYSNFNQQQQQQTIIELTPSQQIRRTSDIALTMLFGLILDFDLWCNDVMAAATIFHAVAVRYGYVSCVTTGYVLRSQISVQHLLDQTRFLRFDQFLSASITSPSTSSVTQQQSTSTTTTTIQRKVVAVESLVTSLSRIVQTMILSSLSNTRSIVQGERDVLACVRALCDSSMGYITSHVILTALVGILIWCEVLPVEAIDNCYQYIQPSHDDEHKIEVASRLGRNLLVSLFHEVVAPVLLSRTVFNGDSSTHTSSSSPQYNGSSNSVILCWQYHWRLSLLLFTWVASIAGPEGVIVSKSTGSLILASSLAGSLDGALEGADPKVMATLFMPSPAMSLLIGASLRNEWSYKDLIADRLQIMIPMLPGIIVSLLSHPHDSEATKPISAKVLNVLATMLTSVGGAFHRVFGELIPTSGHQNVRSRTNSSSESLKAAKSYVPHLMVIVMVLENHITRTPVTKSNNLDDDGGQLITYSRLETSSFNMSKTDDKVKSDVSTDNVIEGIDIIPSSSDIKDLRKFLLSCQTLVLDTICGLLSNAMSLGGAGAAIPLWSSVLVTLEESASYNKSETSKFDSQIDDNKIEENVASIDGNKTDSQLDKVAHNVLCRTISFVFGKSIKRERQWEIWGYEQCAAMSKLIDLVDERKLLCSPIGMDNRLFSGDQVALICAILDVLEYGRDNSGWLQLRLPSMATDSRSGKPVGDMTANSKLLLPILFPCLRLLLGAMRYVPVSLKISANENSELTVSDEKGESLLGRILPEIDQSLTASIVGLTFSSARDTALEAMSAFRFLVKSYDDNKDVTNADIYRKLYIKVAGELRYRYESERRLRENALFDAYEDITRGNQAAHESLAVERLFLGDAGLGDSTTSFTEEIVFNSPRKSQVKANDDFVLFHEPVVGQQAEGKVSFSEINGLGAALEECVSSKSATDPSTEYELYVSALSPFLNAWDAAATGKGLRSNDVKVFKSEARSQSPSRAILPKQISMIGSDSAADAMSSFFEFSAGEKSRLQELSIRFFPGQRSSRKAFAERYCWARYMEVASFSVERLWERTVSDGNRDIRSRIPTSPCAPQFRRYLPKYLDNSSEQSESTSFQDGVSPVKSGRHASMTPLEMDTLTKSLLKTGVLEIVDITKKEINEADLLEPVPTSSTDFGDDDDDAIEFGDSGKSIRDTASPNNQDDNITSDTIGLDDESDDLTTMNTATKFGTTTELSDKWHHSITASSFATPPDNSSTSLSLMHSAAANLIERHFGNCTHVKAEGNRQCEILITSSHLILEYDFNTDGLFEGELLAFQEDADRQKRMSEDFSYDQNPEALNQQFDEKRQREIATLRPKSIKWNLSEVSHVYLRRYRLRDSALELFVIPTGGTSFGGFGMFSPASSLFLDFGSGHEATGRRDEAAIAIMRRVPPQAIKQWPDNSEQFLHDQLNRLTVGWVEGRITNFDYLLHLNIISGRSYNDTCQYPVFPWVLADYTSTEIPDLTDRKNFRDLSKPVGALNPSRLKDFVERFNTFADPSIPPFMYGSHYSTSAGVVLHFLVRMHPFAGLHRQLQGGHFDVADRLFSSIPRTWSMCTGSSAAEVKELTPEWYCNPSFLRNENSFKLGTSQDGEVISDVILPPWAKNSPEKFIEVMRAALESDICSEMLSDWIDLIFGRKQQGPESVKANNVFFYLTYYGTVDVASIEDEALRKATELQIAHFGQCPMQLFIRPHIRRLPRNYFNLSIYQVFSAYSQRQLTVTVNSTKDSGNEALDGISSTSDRARLHAIFGEPMFLPFSSAPMSHWVHSSAPPPGPHSPLIAVRLAGIDRCLAVDTKGIFHFFRWAWRNDELLQQVAAKHDHFDAGCFVVQRELPRFKTVPRLMFSERSDSVPAVAISKTLFANRSVLLVLSNGDNHGSLAMQLVDPAKGIVRGEVLVPHVHAAKISCIATDAIGTAAGHGGIGGELVLVGSEDGNASLWRFMSSQYLPLRPRLRLQGHKGAKVRAVALCSSIHVGVTVSSGKCCVHSIGNGALTRSFGPPIESYEIPGGEDVKFTTIFADTPALAVSVQGFIITVCETSIHSTNLPERKVISINLFTIEGVSLGSTPLESWRGIPHKIYCTPDGTTVMVCSGRGVTIHRLSALQPLKFLDEMQVTESEDYGKSLCAAWDIDFGPALNRPVVAVAACSGGALRLHALPGISAWSERHKKSGLTQTVGSALATPARRITSVVREGLGFGRQLAGMGRDIHREVATDVKERGVGGFLGNVMSRMNMSNSK